MSENGNKRLGRGLAALIGDLDAPVVPEARPGIATAAHGSDLPQMRLPIEQIRANPNNPRRVFETEALEELAASLRQHGLVQPILVRPSSEGYEIVAGERRWRAAQMAELDEVPVVVREVDDRTALELAIIENVQRADLDPIEEARGYQLLMDEHEYSQADLGQVIGKSRSHVANTLRLLKLPDGVLRLVSDGSLSAGHARALVVAPHPEAMAARVIDGQLSVRDTERLVGEANASVPPKRLPVATDPDDRALQQRIENSLGLKSKLQRGANGGGRLTIEYRTLEQFDSLLQRLGIDGN